MVPFIQPQLAPAVATSPWVIELPQNQLIYITKESRASTSADKVTRENLCEIGIFFNQDYGGQDGDIMKV